MSSIERLPCGVVSSSRCETFIDRPLLSAEKIWLSAEVVTVTALRSLA